MRIEDITRDERVLAAHLDFLGSTLAHTMRRMVSDDRQVECDDVEAEALYHLVSMHYLLIRMRDSCGKGKEWFEDDLAGELLESSSVRPTVREVAEKILSEL